MPQTLQEMFTELFGRPPRAGELGHPYYIAQLRRFGAGNGMFTAGQLTQSGVLMAFPHIMDDNGGLYYGGDQSWYAESAAPPRRSIESISGCGVVSAVDCLVTFAYGDEALAARLGVHFHLDSSLSKADFLELMKTAYREIGTAELPGYAPRYRKGRYRYEEKCEKAAAIRASGKKKRDPVPPSLGVLGGRYVRGTVRLAKKHGLKLVPHAMPALYTGYDEGLDFIKKGIAAGSPVDILTSFNTHEMTLFSKGYGIPAHARRRANALHHVVVVAVYDDAATGDAELLVSTWGKLASISYRALHASWQTHRAVGAGIYYFTPTNNEQKVKRALRGHRGGVWASVGRLLFRRAPKRPAKDGIEPENKPEEKTA